MSNAPGQGVDNPVLTPNWIEVPCRFRYALSDGSAWTGKLLCEPVGANFFSDDNGSVPVGVASTRRIITVTAEAVTVQDELGNTYVLDLGSADFTLPNTDFGGGGWLWQIAMLPDDKKSPRIVKLIEVPLSALEDGIDIASAIGMEPPAGLPASLVTRAMYDDLLAKVNGLLGIQGQDGPINLDGFENQGYNDGDVLTPGYGRLEVDGLPLVEYDSAIHGDFGIHFGGVANWGKVTYGSPNTAAQDISIYFRVNTFGADPIPLVQFRSTQTGQSGGVYIRSGGNLDIRDLNNNSIAGSVSAAKVTAGVVCRLDARSELLPGNQQKITYQVFTVDSEGATPTDSKTAQTTSAVPDLFVIGVGQNDADWDMDIDTVRTKSGITNWIPAYSPSQPNWLHNYEATNDGAVSIGAIGAEDIISLGGSVAFASGSAIHGTRGLACNAGWVSYSVQSQAGEFQSLYYRVRVVGGSPSPLVNFLHQGTSQAQIRVRTGASSEKLGIADGSGNSMVQTVSQPLLDAIARVDFKHGWTNGTGLTVTLRLMINPEDNNSAGEEITYTFPAGLEPDTVQIGFPGAGWQGDIDTHRTFPTATDWGQVPPYGTGVVGPAGSFSYAAYATQNTVEMAAYAQPGSKTKVGMALSTSADMSSPTYLAPTASVDFGFYRWSGVAGLTPDTDYWYQTYDEVGGVKTLYDDVGHFHTLQPALANLARPLKIAFLGCNDTPPTPTYVYEDIAAWAPERVEHLGDDGYPDLQTGSTPGSTTIHHQYQATMGLDPDVAAFRRARAVNKRASDHDANGGQHNGVGNGPNFNDPVTQACIATYLTDVPIRNEDTRTPPRAIYSHDVEGKILFVNLWQRTLDRTDTTSGHGALDPTTTMLGATQLAFLESQIDYAQTHGLLVCIFTDSAWNGDGSEIPVNGKGNMVTSYTDKWPAYQVERDAISKYASDRGVSLVICHSDSHGLQFDNGTHEPHGHMVACGGPVANNCHMHFQDRYDYSWPEGLADGGGDAPFKCAYQQLTFTQVDDTHIKVEIIGRDCTAGSGDAAVSISPTGNGLPMTRTYAVAAS